MNKIVTGQTYISIGIAAVFITQIILDNEIDSGFWFGVLLVMVAMFLPVVYYSIKNKVLKSK